MVPFVQQVRMYKLYPSVNEKIETAVALKTGDPPLLNLIAGYVTAIAKLHDHRRITCYPPAFRYHHLVLIRPKHF